MHRTPTPSTEALLATGKLGKNLKLRGSAGDEVTMRSVCAVDPIAGHQLRDHTHRNAFASDR